MLLTLTVQRYDFEFNRWKRWGPDPVLYNESDRLCVTTRCLEASIDAWMNSDNGSALQFDFDV